MKLVLSFDDGRSDQYYAFKLLKNANIKASFHITTGFVDGSFRTNVFGINRLPLSVEQIREMSDFGMDISSHGDKHIFKTTDFVDSFEKLSSWGIIRNKTGFSIPCSEYTQDNLDSFFQENESKLSYIRVGRSKKCYTVFSKCFYLLYHVFHFQLFFDLFNKHNLICSINRKEIFSLVVKKDTKVKNIINFIDKHKSEDCYLVLMFHSIVKKPSNKWEYSLDNFSKLCNYLENNPVKIVTLNDLVK